MSAVQQRLFDVGGYRQRVQRMERPGRWSKHATAARAAIVYQLKPSFGSFVAYIEAILSKDQFTDDTNEQLTDALACEERTVQRHLAEARRLGIFETRTVRRNGRQRRLLVPGPRLLEAAEAAPPEQRLGVTDPVTPTRQILSPKGDGSCHPGVTDPVTPQRGVEQEKGRSAEPPQSSPPTDCRRCGTQLDPTDVDNDGRQWPICRDCNFGEPQDPDEETLMTAAWGPPIGT